MYNLSFPIMCIKWTFMSKFVDLSCIFIPMYEEPIKPEVCMASEV